MTLTHTPKADATSRCHVWAATLTVGSGVRAPLRPRLFLLVRSRSRCGARYVSCRWVVAAVGGPHAYPKAARLIHSAQSRWFGRLSGGECPLFPVPVRDGQSIAPATASHPEPGHGGADAARERAAGLGGVWLSELLDGHLGASLGGGERRLLRVPVRDGQSIAPATASRRVVAHSPTTATTTVRVRRRVQPVGRARAYRTFSVPRARPARCFHGATAGIQDQGRCHIVAIAAAADVCAVAGSALRTVVVHTHAPPAAAAREGHPDMALIQQLTRLECHIMPSREPTSAVRCGFWKRTCG